MAYRPHLFTIHHGSPFLETLVDALLDGVLVPGFAPRHDPVGLSSATIYLPTRRAIRALRSVFLEKTGAGAVLLPRLMALGEIDDEVESFESDAPDLPEAVSSLERQIALTRLILSWSSALKQALLPLPGAGEPLLVPSSPGDAASLAARLGEFLDGMQIDRVTPQALAALTDSHAGLYDKYWDLTIRFLEIATRQWPEHLQEIGRQDAVLLRNVRMEREAARLANDPQAGPVIVAGSTGSIPATRDLIKAVAIHPVGAVVLPGLDLDLDLAGWSQISGGEGVPTHPQAGLVALLAALGVERDAVQSIGAPAGFLALRASLVSQAMRPANTTDLWVNRRPHEADAVATAFAGVSIIEAAHEGEEALAAALALRETVSVPGRSAALVTPDRQIAARVVVELARWGIVADDSAGKPLASTVPGVFSRLVLDAALTDFEPVALLALLKHPLMAPGMSRPLLEQAVMALEVGGLRGPAPGRGVAGLKHALEHGRASLADPHCSRARMRLSEADWAAAARLVEALETTLEPFASLLRDRGEKSAVDFFTAHRLAVEALACPDSQDDTRLAEDEASLALQAFFSDLCAVKPEELALPAAEYPGLYAALIAGRAVRGGEPRHPRIAIYGLLEARLLPVDRLVLAGLDEGIWPPEVKSDPWLNRPMRAAIGLSSPEKRVGLAAHDFEQALGGRDVIITRAFKRGGAPAVPSRWLQRLSAFLGPACDGMLERGQRYCQLARQLDSAPARVPAPAAPCPCPQLSLRPVRLSVTQIEDLLRDPYTIYARHILQLEALDDIAGLPGPAQFGTLMHTALERFAHICSDGVPVDALQRFSVIGDELFAPFADFPDVLTFWRPRFETIAAFMVNWEKARRSSLCAVQLETAGKLEWQTASGRTFTLAARADRLEVLPDGSVRILDFKTGQAPTGKQIQSGLSPQIALEMAILMEAGFRNCPAPGSLAAPSVVSLKPRLRDCEERVLEFRDAAPEDIAAETLGRLKTLIDQYEDEKKPYASFIHPMFTRRRYGDYDHLARIREWSLGAGEEE